MKQWSTPLLTRLSSGSEDKIPVGLEFFIFAPNEQQDPQDEEGES